MKFKNIYILNFGPKIKLKQKDRTYKNIIKCYMLLGLKAMLTETSVDVFKRN